jgi:photosystem II stability/assembly factor-like uncharacterized protein
MPWQSSASPTLPADEPLLGSAGCCGVIARVLGATALVVALAVLGLLLVMGDPNRWQGIADPAAHPLALVSDPKYPQTLYLGTEQGHVLISHDGGQSWREQHQGLPPATPISALALLPNGTQALAGTSKGAYLSADGGHTWQSVGPGIPPHTIVDAVSVLSDGTLLAGTASQGVYVSHSGGATWTPAAAGLPPQSDIYAFLALPPSGHVLAALISGGIYASSNDGMTWAESDQGLGAAAGVNVFSFLSVPGHSGTDPVILAGTSRGVYASRDLGTIWAPSSAGIGTTRVISLACDPLVPTSIFGGADTGVYQSRDGGATWRIVGYGLPSDQHVGVVGVIHPSSGQQVILASLDRLYRYPGQWLLASEPWRALGFGALGLLAAALVAYIVWQVRTMRDV